MIKLFFIIFLLLLNCKSVNIEDSTKPFLVGKIEIYYDPVLDRFTAETGGDTRLFSNGCEVLVFLHENPELVCSDKEIETIRNNTPIDTIPLQEKQKF